MLILAIETATDRCSVALVEDDAVVADLLLARPRSHAEFLVPMVEQALGMGRFAAGDLDAVAVSMGPGSYTGLRIGVSVAKGLSFATGARLVGVPSLAALALAVAEHAEDGDHVLAAFAARREEVYAALFRVERVRPTRERLGSTRAHVVAACETAAVSVAELGPWLPDVPGRLWIAGDGAEKSLEAIDAAGVPSQDARRLSAVLPTATTVARAGSEILESSGGADLETFEPYYLKEFVAKKPERTIFDRLPF